MQHAVIGMDIATHVFQLHSVRPDTGAIERTQLKRAQVLPLFRQPLARGGGARNKVWMDETLKTAVPADSRSCRPWRSPDRSLRATRARCGSC